MSTAIERRLVTDRLLAVLAEATGRAVGDNEPPVDGAVAPWTVLFSLNGGAWEDSLLNPERDANFVYRVTSVGESRASAEWMGDAVREVMVGIDPETGVRLWPIVDPEAGVVVASVDMAGPPAGAEAVGESTTRTWNVTEDYLVMVTRT